MNKPFFTTKDFGRLIHEAGDEIFAATQIANAKLEDKVVVDATEWESVQASLEAWKSRAEINGKRAWAMKDELEALRKGNL